MMSIRKHLHSRDGMTSMRPQKRKGRFTLSRRCLAWGRTAHLCAKVPGRQSQACIVSGTQDKMAIVSSMLPLSALVAMSMTPSSSRQIVVKTSMLN
ncbi:hypothetical protein WJX77_005443 [Trebouxia sp. C0004]